MVYFFSRDRGLLRVTWSRKNEKEKKKELNKTVNSECKMSSAYVWIMWINILLVEERSVSNLMPKPGVGNLRSSSVSQHVVLHAFHTGVLTHFRAIRRLVILHFCKYKHKLGVTLVLCMNTKELKCRQNAFLNAGTTASCHLKTLYGK